MSYQPFIVSLCVFAFLTQGHSQSIQLRIVGDTWVQVCYQNTVEVPCPSPMSPIKMTEAVAYDDGENIAIPKEKQNRFFLWKFTNYLFGGFVSSQSILKNLCALLESPKVSNVYM